MIKNNASKISLPVIMLCGLFAGIINAQTSYTFTSAGVTGRLGPNQTQINTAYSLTNLNGSVTTVSGIQNFTVPNTGPYSIDVYGASGGTVAVYSGYGARAMGEVTLTGGSVLSILVGQMGSSYATTNSDGGGGGSFVAVGPTLLFAAGGGGGGAQLSVVGQNAQTGTTVVNGTASTFGSSGAGYTVNGTNFTYAPYTAVAQSFTNGGNGQAGGQAGGWPGGTYGDGGFGGGGSSCSCSTGGGGGGGGFIGGGGGGGSYTSGYGGSSYLIGTAINTLVATLGTFGNGKVIITSLCNNLPAAPTNSTNITSQTVCPGGTTALSAVGAGTNITWYPTPTSSLVLGSGTTFITPTLSAGTYSFYAAETNTCSQGPRTAITVTVIPPPAVSISGATLCTGYTVNLTASGADTYSWSTGATTPTINAAAGGQFTVAGTSTLTGCSSMAVSNLSLLPAPSLTIAGATTICAGTTSSLTASGADSYFWNTGSINPTLTTTLTNNTTYTLVGTYTLNGCTTRVQKSIAVNPLPVLTASGTRTICAGQSTTITASGAAGYYWNTGASTNSVVLSPSVSTTYSVVGVSTLACTNTLVVNIFLECVGIKSFGNTPYTINVYPNPNNGEFYIELSNNLAKEIEVVDLTGRVIYNKSDSSDKIKINLTNVESGIYYVKVTSANTTKTFKITKQ